ncbi:MAG: hypothetical protein DLM57_17305 [Pseudonocardiales bacterium]|nr:MAG: hypothetical protein DLM57_17305 [Pseudonocardiales bacterium]
MRRLRSGPLAAWTAAWLAGTVGSDDVVRAIVAADTPHQVGGLGTVDAELVPLADVLTAWRRAGGPVRLVLPVAGDVRGLPGPAGFRNAALETGEAVCGTRVGIVPTVVEFAPSSAPPSVLWQAFDVADAPADFIAVADAQYDLTTAIRESASALSAADVAGLPAGVADALHDARRSGEHVNLPPGFPARAVALVAQAERLQAMLSLAAQDPTGGAIDRAGVTARIDALRPLATAVRRARLAGYNALAV